MKLSAALIVKNEERNIKRCLSSICRVVDEIVVVDTGSTDRTVKICEQFGAKVYHHPWENDFSKHRNQSFGYATGDWIFQIDADEQFVYDDQYQGKPQVLKNFLSMVKSGYNSVGLRMRDMRNGSIWSQFEIIRIFRKGKVEFKNIVHNEPVYDGDSVFFQVAYLNHFGYDLSAKEKAAKAARTITLLDKRLRENPKDYDALFYKTEALTSWTDNVDTALKCGNQYIELKDEIEEKGHGFFKQIYYLLITVYRTRKDYKNVLRILEKALKAIPDDLDIAMSLMLFGVDTNNEMYVAEGANRFIRLYESFEKDVSKRAGQFVFNYTPSAYAYCLYRLFLCHASRLKAVSGRLGEMMKFLPEKMRTDLQKEMNKNIDFMDLKKFTV